MNKLVCLLLLSLCVVGTYSDVAYNNLNAEAQGQFQFHKLSKFKRQSPIPEPTITNTTVDNHIYYTSTYHGPGPTAEGLWIDLSNQPGLENVDLTHPVLSVEYRYFASHPLPFNFSYYGHLIDSIVVTTGGFLYTSPYLHPELISLTHNIAPLQADFNPSVNDTAQIFIQSTADRFTVQWDKVHNHDHVDAGPFTFQVSLFKNGTIHFVYKEIPLALSEIDNGVHPVEVGLSDSFYYDEEFPGQIIVRSVYEYSRVQLNASDNLAYSAYVINPVLNCVVGTSCEECSRLNDVTIFDCEWCPTLNRCSDGIDRFTQEWFDSKCDETAAPTCLVTAAPLSAGGVAGISVAAVVILALIVFVIGGVVIVFIGYRRPTSKLGLFLIEHRPKARSLNKSSASYNVDSGKAELKEDLAA